MLRNPRALAILFAAALMIVGTYWLVARQPSMMPPPTHLDGLKITDVQIGQGAIAKELDKVKFEYRAYLLDFSAPGFKGRPFDNSYDSGQPLAGILGDHLILPGLEKAIEGMKAGGHRIALVPSQLAYGLKGNGNLVPPNTDIYFEIHLISVGD